MIFLAQTGQTQPLPPMPTQPSVGLETGTLISLFVMGITGTAGILGAIGNNLWGWFKSKDQAETDQLKQFWTLFLQERTQLLEINKQGFSDTVNALGSLKDSNNQVAQAIHQDVQSSLTGQTAIYKNIQDSLAEIKLDVKALHRRWDESTDERRGRDQRQEINN